MNCCDERRLVSVVTRVEHHRARGGSRSGDGVGRDFPISSVVVKVLSGFVAFVHLKNKIKIKSKAKGPGFWATQASRWVSDVTRDVCAIRERHRTPN